MSQLNFECQITLISFLENPPSSHAIKITIPASAISVLQPRQVEQSLQAPGRVQPSRANKGNRMAGIMASIEEDDDSTTVVPWRRKRQVVESDPEDMFDVPKDIERNATAPLMKKKCKKVDQDPPRSIIPQPPPSLLPVQPPLPMWVPPGSLPTQKPTQKPKPHPPIPSPQSTLQPTSLPQSIDKPMQDGGDPMQEDEDERFTPIASYCEDWRLSHLPQTQNPTGWFPFFSHEYLYSSPHCR